MKFNVLSLVLLTAFALNVKAEEAKSDAKTPATEQHTPANTEAGKTDTSKGTDTNITTNAKQEIKATASATEVKEDGLFTKALNAVKGKATSVSKAIKANAAKLVEAVKTSANNVASNSVSTVKNHKVATAVVVAAVTGYIAALNGVFGKKIEKFTNKYKQFVAGAATVASAVLLYNLATATPEVKAAVVEAVKVAVQKAVEATPTK